jgi:hypothetical protein
MASLTFATRSDRPLLLRRDVKGRVRISRGRRELPFAEFDRSGVSDAVFARMAGIKCQAFAGWLQVCRGGGRRHALKAAAAVRGGSLPQMLAGAVAGYARLHGTHTDDCPPLRS